MIQMLTKGGEMSKYQTVGVDSEDDSDDCCDFAEANCELAMVQGQLCSTPYELYDLPDLTGVLSVETWNSFLTEEERFFLSCFLPDMDQETFTLTMHQLLGGGNLFFGNPVDKFFMKLRGGLFTPKVACYNEGAMFFKRKVYYYSLRFYHQKLIKTFTEMQRLWDQFGKELGNYERLLLWSERRQTGNLKLLDFKRRVPSEEIDGATCNLTHPNVVKPMDRNRTRSLTSHRSGSSENSLNIKITERGIFWDQGSSLVSSEHRHQSLPKGLLKLVPKSSSAILGEPYVASEKNLLQIHETGSKSTGFVASPFSGTRFTKPYGTIASSITDLPNCLLNHQDTSFTSLETTQRSSIEETEPVLHDPTDTICRGLGASNYSITEQNLLTEKEEYVHCHLKSIHDNGYETMETESLLSGKNFQRDANVLRNPLGALSRDNHARDIGDDHLFSLTYKRRKVHRIGVA